MNRRIFAAIFATAGAVLLAAVVMAIGALYEYFSQVEQNLLRSELTLAAQGLNHEGAAYLEGLELDGFRLTWVDGDGAVRYDSQAPAEELDNHSHRPEIQQALISGEGTSQRLSATLGQRTVYRALRLTDGTVLRLAISDYTALRLAAGLSWPLLLVLVAALLLSAALARRLARRIVEPLNRLDLEHPLENDAYPELALLLERLDMQQEQLRRGLSRLRQQKEEFAAVTNGMSEGLVLLNSQGDILSINPAAAGFFQLTDKQERLPGDSLSPASSQPLAEPSAAAGQGMVGQNILSLCRDRQTQELIGQAQTGQNGECRLELAGRLYQLHAHPVPGEDGIAGVCLLLFDVTQQAWAEQQRQEFSANVSHELKTPLQVISGAAELIENSLVQPEDLPAFGGRIRAESARLLALINDVIRLSQLDEGAAPPREPVELLALCREAVQALEPEATARHITLSVSGDTVTLNGVRRLLLETVTNLCDNAIRYNVEGGWVRVTVKEGEQEARLTVADSGVGIPLQHQARVFERFFRVDKSHSKATGGTGLGLSIVKHAVACHQGHITLTSQPGQGTEITVTLPLHRDEETPC